MLIQCQFECNLFHAFSKIEVQNWQIDTISKLITARMLFICTWKMNRLFDYRGLCV